MKPADNPYLTVVAASRNDDHGGDPLRRTQIFVNAFADQCREFRLPAELILVDWNPPTDRPSLHKALSWDRCNDYCRARVICVPPELHARMRYSAKLPLFQMIAKNVGIRNARGTFVLATNIDILFSSQLIEQIAQQRLQPDRLYRVDRYDIDNAIPSDAPWREQIEFCWSNIVRINYRDGIKPAPSRSAAPWSGNGHPAEPSVAEADIRGDRLHTMACGDFTLISREQWHRLRGYPEFEAYSFHIDSVGCFMAHYGGVLEQTLPPPCVAFHIEHSQGSGFTPEGAAALFQRLESAGIPSLEYAQLFAMGEQMRQQKEAIIFNDETWGLGRYPLEQIPVPGMASLQVVRPIDDKQADKRALWVPALKPEYDFEKLRADHLHQANRQLHEQLHHIFRELPPRGKGVRAWWCRSKARWKRSLFKRLVRW